MNYEPNRPPKAVILAAGISSRLRPLTDHCPKSLLSVGGTIILERIIRSCLSCGISQFVLVLGHHADQIQQFVNKKFRGIRVTYVVNERYHDTNTSYSLMLASSAIAGSEFIKFDDDVVFDTRILRGLLDNDQPNVLCVDRNFASANEELRVVLDDQMRVLEIGKAVDPTVAMGRSIGIEKISAKTAPALFAELAEMMKSQTHLQHNYGVAYERLVIQGSDFYIHDVTGMNWAEINTAEDFAAANVMFGMPFETVSRGQQKALDRAASIPLKPS